jgi:hypothetical protein
MVRLSHRAEHKRVTPHHLARETFPSLRLNLAAKIANVLLDTSVEGGGDGD